MGICKSESENKLRENQPPSPLGARDAENEETDRVGKRGSLAGEGGGGVTRGVGSRGRPRAGDPAGRMCPAGGHQGRAGLCRLPLPGASARTARSRGPPAPLTCAGALQRAQPRTLRTRAWQRPSLPRVPRTPTLPPPPGLPVGTGRPRRSRRGAVCIAGTRRVRLPLAGCGGRWPPAGRDGGDLDPAGRSSGLTGGPGCDLTPSSPPPQGRPSGRMPEGRAADVPPTHAEGRGAWAPRALRLVARATPRSRHLRSHDTLCGWR